MNRLSNRQVIQSASSLMTAMLRKVLWQRCGHSLSCCSASSTCCRLRGAGCGTARMPSPSVTESLSSWFLKVLYMLKVKNLLMHHGSLSKSMLCRKNMKTAPSKYLSNYCNNNFLFIAYTLMMVNCIVYKLFFIIFINIV